MSVRPIAIPGHATPPSSKPGGLRRPSYMTPMEWCLGGDEDDDDADSGPPSPSPGQITNFGVVVAPTLYRSGFPHASNLRHLESLRLTTVITLVSTAFETPVLDFIRQAGIRHFCIPLPAHKTANASMPLAALAQVLKIILDASAADRILIHCNKGKHRTGCVIAALRRLAMSRSLKTWMHPQPVIEYRDFAREKARNFDEDFIRTFDVKAAWAAIDQMAVVPLQPTVAKFDLVQLPTPPPSAASESEDDRYSLASSTDVEDAVRSVRPGFSRINSDVACLGGSYCVGTSDTPCPFAIQHELELE